MFNVLQVKTARAAVLQHHSNVQCTASTATSQQCAMYCGTQHLALQYCDTTTMFHVLQVATASTCSNVNIAAMFKVLQVLQHHSNIQRTAGRNSTAVLQHHGNVQCTAGHNC
jgi:hypothetical protein